MSWVRPTESRQLRDTGRDNTHDRVRDGDVHMGFDAVRETDRGTDRDSDNGTDRDSDNGTDRDSDRDTDRYTDPCRASRPCTRS